MKLPGGKTLASTLTGRVRTDATTRPRGHGVSARTHLPPLSLPSPSPLPPSPPPSPSLPPLYCPRGRKGCVSADAKKLKNNFKIFFGSSCRLGKREKIYNLQFSVFGCQSPNSPSSAGFAGEAARRRRFFRPTSPSHPSKLYSSLGWLNSKVPKPFPPFSLRLIDVDGF
jgi:hypothetical protein